MMYDVVICSLRYETLWDETKLMDPKLHLVYTVHPTPHHDIEVDKTVGLSL